MSVCPVCNGLRPYDVPCTNCSLEMVDQGKVSDYFDDYSPYMEIDWMKLEDGYDSNWQRKVCVHLYQCPGCGNDQMVFINE